MKRNTIIILGITTLIAASLIFIIITNDLDNDGADNHLNDQNNTENNSFNPLSPVFTIEKDRFNKTITITSIEGGEDLFWYNIELINGTATLPEGAIEVGDMIINCTEILDFRWTPTDEVVLHVEFVRGE